MVDSINPTHDYILRMLKLQNVEQIMKKNYIWVAMIKVKRVMNIFLHWLRIFSLLNLSIKCKEIG